MRSIAASAFDNKCHRRRLPNQLGIVTARLECIVKTTVLEAETARRAIFPIDANGKCALGGARRATFDPIGKIYMVNPTLRSAVDARQNHSKYALPRPRRCTSQPLERKPYPRPSTVRLPCLPQIWSISLLLLNVAVADFSERAEIDPVTYVSMLASYLNSVYPVSSDSIRRYAL